MTINRLNYAVIAILCVSLFLIGTVIGLVISPPKYVDSHIQTDVEKNFSRCMYSPKVVELTLTIETVDSTRVPNDSLCPTNVINNNFYTYVTTEGIFIDINQLLVKGDKIKIKGMFYLQNDKVILNSILIEPIDVKYSAYYGSPTPTPTNVK